MKILIAIESKDNAKSISNQSLKFVGRLGYAFQLFVPKSQRHKYREAILDANYHWYLAIDPKTHMNTKITLEEYIKANNVDLLIKLPDDFQPNEDVFDDTIVSFIHEVGKARTVFSQNPKKLKIKLGEGIYMERIKR